MRNYPHKVSVKRILHMMGDIIITTIMHFWWRKYCHIVVI